MRKDYEYRYYMDDNKLMRFHAEQQGDIMYSPRDEWDYEYKYDKMYLENRDYCLTDDKIKDEVKSNDDAIRMMIDDANIDVVSAVREGLVPRMAIKYDVTNEEYELYIDGEFEDDSTYAEWLDDAIIDNLTIDELKGMSDDLYVVPLDLGYYGDIKEAYDYEHCDGYIWSTKEMMINAGFKDMTDEDLCKRAYDILSEDIEEEDLWSTGNVFWFETEVCNDVINADDERNWEICDSVSGYIVDGYRAFDCIYENEIGVTPYHDSIDDLFEWPEFKISFDDYYKTLNEADALDDLDNIRETLKDKIDWSDKSLADYMKEVEEEISGDVNVLSAIVGTLRGLMREFDNKEMIGLFEGAMDEFKPLNERYKDMQNRLIELKALA